MKIPLGCDRFGKGLSGIGLREKGLTLEIRGFDEISVNDAKPADAGADQEVGSGSANRTTANQDGTGGAQTLLSFAAKRRKQHLARVFLLQRVNHVK